MREFHLRTEQTLDAPLDRVFAFFSDARNLEAITPPFLKFKITSPLPMEMRVGAQIDYSLRLRGVRFAWGSRITAWEPSVRFVDEQLKGPYRLWVHEHAFRAVEAGRRTVVADHVQYAVPGWALESAVNAMLVRPQLDAIFAYRATATKRLIESAAVQ